MTDQTKNEQTEMTESSEGTATNSSATPEAIIGLVTDGAHSLIVAQFRTMDQAQQAYQKLTDLERTTSLRIDGVVIASCDANGDVHLGQMTDHSTKTGLKWGVVGGAVMGIIFPPSIIGTAIAAGGLGAVLGKVRNVFHRSGVTNELANVMQPNTSGVVALVEDRAVVEVREAMATADRIVSRAIDKQIAAEIEREAALAKQPVSTS